MIDIVEYGVWIFFNGSINLFQSSKGSTDSGEEKSPTQVRPQRDTTEQTSSPQSENEPSVETVTKSVTFSTLPSISMPAPLSTTMPTSADSKPLESPRV